MKLVIGGKLMPTQLCDSHFEQFCEDLKRLDDYQEDDWSFVRIVEPEGGFPPEGSCTKDSWAIPKEESKKWNPRYLVYCGDEDPDTVLERDRERYPGGCMAGFILWLHRKWAEWKTMKGYPLTECYAYSPYQEEFDEWLSENRGNPESA